MYRRFWPYLVVSAIAFLSLLTATVEIVLWDKASDAPPPVVPWFLVTLASAAILIGLAIRDLGQLQTALARAKGSRDRLRDGLHHLNDGMALYSPDLHLEWCNDAYRALLGAEGETLQQGDEIPEWLDRTAWETRRVDGRWLWIDRAELISGAVVSIVRDITDRKQAEARLAEADERYQHFLSAAGGWIWESDVLHRFSVVIPVRPEIEATDLQWMVGHHLSELVSRNDGTNITFESCLQDMAMQRRLREATLWLHDGRQARSVRLTGVPRFDPAGNFLGYRGIGAYATAGIPPHEAAKPRMSQPAPLPRREADGATHSLNGDVRRVLVAEDGLTNRTLAESILKRMGYRVDVVENGHEAVAAVGGNRYAAVLMDIWMPEMDGLEATAAIRALPGPERDVPIIAMTAHAGREDRQRCLEAGMNEHIGKPIDRRRLAEVLEHFAGGSAEADALDREAADDAPAEPEPSAGPVDDAVIAELRDDAGDALVDELILTFMRETNERLTRIPEALASDRIDDVAADAHAMKSSSGTFGALLLERLAADLEAAAMGGDAGRAGALAERLPAIVETTWQAFAERGYALKPEEDGS